MFLGSPGKNRWMVDGGILRIADDGTSQEEENADSQDSQEEDDLELELNL